MNKKELRDKFFKEHTYKCENGIPLVCTHPHNLFEWMYEQLTLTDVVASLPDANKLYKMAETIVSKQVVIYNTPENKQIDWEELKNDWFDWLNEEIKG